MTNSELKQAIKDGCKTLGDVVKWRRNENK